MIIKINSALTFGIDCQSISIEIASEPYTQFSLSILGISEYFSRQMKNRIEIACKTNGIELPPIKITVNLGHFKGDKQDILSLDLPIALGILSCIGSINLDFKDTLIVGELGLDGNIRPIKGALSIALHAMNVKKKSLYLPKINSAEVDSLQGITIYPVSSLQEILENRQWPLPHKKISAYAKASSDKSQNYSEVKGQLVAKRAMQIAAAGFHNTIFMGPPGSGKTMLAQRLPSIMPQLSYEQILETSRVYSSMGTYHKLIQERPFRSPHHSATVVQLIGGGISTVMPGEISLAHNGILFLDEFTEFKTSALEALRQPLESHTISITRKGISAVYPAHFLLIAAFNPCPCGHAGDPKKKCECTVSMIRSYLGKLSGPLLDRIDIQLSLRAVEYHHITDNTQQLDSKIMAQNVAKALTIQEKRFGNTDMRNGTMNVADLQKYCVLDEAAEVHMKKAFEVLNLSMRSYHKILRVARTIADLAGAEHIKSEHISEALTYRSLDSTISKLKS